MFSLTLQGKSCFLIIVIQQSRHLTDVIVCQYVFFKNVTDLMLDFIGGSCNITLLDVLACEQPQYIYRHLTALKRL